MIKLSTNYLQYLYKQIQVSIVCFLLMLAEFAGGIYAGSLAIISDAAHMFSDLSGFFISILSIKLAKR
jgi:zinc transporter 2